MLGSTSELNRSTPFNQFEARSNAAGNWKGDEGSEELRSPTLPHYKNAIVEHHTQEDGFDYETDMRVSMTSRKRMEDSERWCAVGRIEAGQSITDVALFFGVHHSVISRLWKQFQTPQTVVRRPVGGFPRVTTPAEV
ncbi:uncharacterized protein TNCV_3091401 [Trichonephila clavipes]|uniref:Uncharacterized protein n=1 Tax=Trichonephila clavipes TaxID=2585209 RepID=A0A8X6W8C9_TRICX|nr:uncharacterized protein TNCV_3091401 [Trichonephila clavipes]